MDSLVELKDVSSGKKRVFTFEVAQNILRDINNSKHKAWVIADKKKFQFINNELNKRPSPKVGKKSAKPKGDIEGEGLPK